MKPVIIVAGYGVRYPLGGHLLSQLYYLAGLQNLGYEPVWVEHYGWPNSCFDPERGVMSDDPSYGLEFVRRGLSDYGVKRWCYVDAVGRYHGMQREDLKRLCRESVLLLSPAATTWVGEFNECRTRAFVDTDPGFTQFKIPPTRSPSCAGYASPWDFHHLFTLGERIGKPDCLIPTHGLTWHPTRWPFSRLRVDPQFTPEAKIFSTVMSWSAYGSSSYNGVCYGQKDLELLKLLDLPSRTGKIFELAIGGTNVPIKKLTAAGWMLSQAETATRTMEDYLAFIGRSRGEFSVAKHGYVATRGGWFSERTLTYLASGKPVIVQDTGFSETLPCGEGLFAFRNAEEVITAVDAIQSDYKKHCLAARQIAGEYFAADKILGAMLQVCGLPAKA